MTYILPKGPKTSQILQFINFIKNPINMLRSCYNTYGDSFTLKLIGQMPYVIISDPDDIKSVFMEHDGALSAGAANGTVLRPIVGNFSLLTLDGEKHMFHRKLMLPPFHGERMKLYGQRMQDITVARITNWKATDKISILDEALHITFDIILHKIFGIEESNHNYLKIKTALRELLNMVETPFGVATLIFKKLHTNLGVLTPWAKIQKLKKEVDAILLEEIKSRISSDLSLQTDILSLLMQAKDEAGNAMTPEEIKDEMITLLIAGHKTTAATIAWSTYYILSNEQILNQLLLELSNARKDSEDIDIIVSKLPYLDAVIKESLRMTPVLPYVGRLTIEPFQLKNILIPRGVVIVPAIYLAHHSASNWPDPEKFMPERWLTKQEKPYTFLPFGGGVRRCIGASFAMYEIKIMLTTILENTKIKLVEGYTPRQIRKNTVMVPSDGVPVIINHVSK